MCLSVPGKIISKTTDAFMTNGKVEFGGVIKDVCLAYVPEAEVGDYVIVHVGFAINKIDEEEAKKTIETIRKYST